MKISIITTLYKGQKYIETLLNNIKLNTINLQKKYPDVKVQYIMVNDYPTEKLRIKNQEYPFELLVIENEVNKGIHKSRSVGVKVSDGDFIQFLDQDDTLESFALLSQYKLIGNNDVVVANGYQYENNGTKKVKIYKSKLSRKIVTDLFFYRNTGCQIASPGQCLIRRKSIPDSWLKHCLKNNCSDDYLLWMMLLERGNKFVMNDYPAFKHNITGKNISSDYILRFRSNMELCHIAQKYKMLSSRTIRSVKSLWIVKYKWNKNNDIFSRFILSLKNPDIMFIAVLWKIMLKVWERE